MRNLVSLVCALTICFSFWQGTASADNCVPVCDSNGCSMDCSSQAPAVTPAGVPSRPPSYNSCQYAFNGSCDDANYPSAQSAACPTGTDETDCNPRMRRAR